MRLISTQEKNRKWIIVSLFSILFVLVASFAIPPALADAFPDMLTKSGPVGSTIDFTITFQPVPFPGDHYELTSPTCLQNGLPTPDVSISISDTIVPPEGSFVASVTASAPGNYGCTVDWAFIGLPPFCIDPFATMCIFGSGDVPFGVRFVAPIGGEQIPLDTTMVLLAGTQTTAAWMIPVIVSGIGFAIVILRKL